MAPEDGWAVGRTTSSSSSSPVATEKLLAQHKEKHFTAGEMVRDVIMGVSDGLTVPFALAAGLSGANAPSSLILTAGFAEVAAGAISMGLGGSVTSSAVPFLAVALMFLLDRIHILFRNITVIYCVYFFHHVIIRIINSYS